MLTRVRDLIVYAVVLALRTLVRALPLSYALALSGALGRSYARLRGPRTGVALENVRLAFPEWPEPRRREVVAESFANLAKAGVEASRLDALDPENVKQLVTIEGREIIERAAEKSRTGGVVMLIAHFGSFELMAVACALQGLPVAIVYRTIANRYLDALVTGWRERAGVKVMARGNAARAALRALREGYLLALPLDQNAKREHGIFVPFFGRDACTRDGPARLALRTGSPVVPAFMFRQPDGRSHVLKVFREIEVEPIEEDPRATVGRLVLRMNQQIEEAIRQAPDHWIWIHRRWKTQPKRPARAPA